MTTTSHKLPLLAKLVRAHLRSNLRGQTRLTDLLAKKVPSLQVVPIDFADRPSVFMDLRSQASQVWLQGSPWESSPQEVGEQAVMRRFVKQGDVVFDVGANLGLHTSLLSCLVGQAGRVYAFEPNINLQQLLAKTIEGLDNTVLMSFALSDEEGSAQLFVPVDHGSMGSLRASNEEGRFGENYCVPCELRRLDDLVSAGVLPRPDFIKCDVEGAELNVFRGGEQTLNHADAPVILFEVNGGTAQAFGHSASAASDFLEGLSEARYELFFIQEDGRLTREKEHGLYYWNLFAVPEARRAKYLEFA